MKNQPEIVLFYKDEVRKAQERLMLIRTLPGSFFSKTIKLVESGQDILSSKQIKKISSKIRE